VEVNLSETLAKNVRSLRESAGLSREGLAALCDPPLSAHAIFMIESQMRWPGVDTLERLGRALKINPLAFFHANLQEVLIVEHVPGIEPKMALAILGDVVRQWSAQNAASGILNRLPELARLLTEADDHSLSMIQSVLSGQPLRPFSPAGKDGALSPGRAVKRSVARKRPQ
jgi:hypothetical protein